MAQCIVCCSDKARDVNRKLLMGGRARELAVEFGFRVQSLRWHKRHHLPWRSRQAKKPETIAEQLEDLKLELRRLQVLAECGASGIGPAIHAVTARRHLLELEARLDHKLGATHFKLFPKAEATGDFEVVFENGKPRTVKVGAE